MKKNYLRWIILIVLLVLSMTVGTVNAQVKGWAYNFNLDGEPMIDEKGIVKSNKNFIKDAKKQHGIRDVTLAITTDYNSYLLLNKSWDDKGLTDLFGNVIIPMGKYSDIKACGEKKEEYEIIRTSLGLYKIYHPNLTGSFVCRTWENGQIVHKIISRQGVESPVTLPNDYCYRAGYLIGGIWGSDIKRFAAPDGQKSVMAASRNNQNDVSIMTSDGDLIAEQLVGFAIDDKKEGCKHQPLTLMRIGADSVLYWGGTMLDDRSQNIPIIFSSAFYNQQNDEWKIQTKPLTNAVTYDPAKHQSVSYTDEGELLYCQQRYDDAVDFYTEREKTSVQLSLHDRVYFAGALSKTIEPRLDLFKRVADSFENLSTGTYEDYYPYREELTTWPETDSKICSKITQLLTNQKEDELQNSEYSKAAGQLQSKAIRISDEYTAEQTRYNNILETLDQRIESYESALQAEAERRAAEEEEAARQRAARAFAIGQSLGRALGSAIAGNSYSSPSKQSSYSSSSRRKTTPSKSSSARSGQLNIDRSSVNGVRARDLPHTSSVDEIESTSSSSSSKSSSGGSVCRQCAGRGYCKTCSGTGIMTGFTLKDKLQCSTCKGSKQCPFCNGTGKR